MRLVVFVFGVRVGRFVCVIYFVVLVVMCVVRGKSILFPPRGYTCNSRSTPLGAS